MTLQNVPKICNKEGHQIPSYMYNARIIIVTTNTQPPLLTGRHTTASFDSSAPCGGGGTLPLFVWPPPLTLLESPILPSTHLLVPFLNMRSATPFHTIVTSLIMGAV